MAYIICVLCFLFQINGYDKDNKSKNDNIGKIGQGKTTDEPKGSKWGCRYLPIMSDKNVIKELNLSKSQSDEYSKVIDEYFERHSKINLKELRTRSVDDISAYNVITVLVGDFSVKVYSILTDAQKERLNQIIFQLRSVEIYYYKDIEQELNYTKEQYKELELIKTSTMENFNELQIKRKAKEVSLEEVQKLSDDILAQANERFKNTLSDQQLQKVKSLEGKKISFKKSDISFVIRRQNKAKDSVETNQDNQIQ